MTHVSVYPDSIYIPVVQSKWTFSGSLKHYSENILAGCMTSEFDSTYRIQLIGILSPDEFQESMKKINQTLISMNNLITICFLIFIFGLPGALIFVMVQLVREDTSAPSAPSNIGVLFGSAIVLSILVFISMAIAIFIVPIGLKRTREVIAKESLKYRSRLPTPCHWRLENGDSRYAPCPSNNILSYRVSIIFSD